MPPIIPISRQFDRSTLEQMRDADPVVPALPSLTGAPLIRPARAGQALPPIPRAPVLSQSLLCAIL